MINKEVLTKAWYEKIYYKYRQTNPALNIQLVEKNINALYLLECLAKSKMEFIFKGGTSLVILLEQVKRLSIDIDIIVENKIENFETILNTVIETSDFFTRYEENERNNAASKRMDLRHFKFFFESALDGYEKYVLLDIAFEKNVYPVIIKSKIECELIKPEGQTIEICTPNIESILGDKLVTLAPNITGIEYDRYKELELMKQVFDVDKLFDKARDLKVIIESFKSTARKEIEYRKLENINYKDVLGDIVNLTKVMICRGTYESEHLKQIQIGMDKLRNYMLIAKFLIDREVLVCASKVLYLSYLIDSNQNFIEKYVGQEIEENDISIQYGKLLKTIKIMNQEAYFYIIKSRCFKNN